MADTVHITRGGRRWHANPNCPSLEAGRMIWDSDEHFLAPIREVPAADVKREPCRICAVPAAAPTR